MGTGSFSRSAWEDLYYNGNLNYELGFDEDTQEIVELHNYERLSKEEYIKLEFDHWFESMRGKK